MIRPMVPRLGVVACIVGVAACLDVTGSPGRLQAEQAAGYWVAHMSGGRFDPYVQLLHVTLTGDSTQPLALTALPTRAWNGDTVVSFDPQSALGAVGTDRVTWVLKLSDEVQGVMDYGITADTLVGTLRLDSAGTEFSFPVMGLRVSSAVLPTVAEAPSTTRDDSTPLVLLRMDDLAPADRGLVAKLEQRGLYAELAIPTAFVGLAGRPTWTEVHDWTRLGFGVAAHSRFHRQTTGSTMEFLGEVLGSLEDLDEHGLPTRVFVQPGSWEDSLDFDSPATLSGWRGALFQTFTSVLEAYARPASVALPMADSMAMGLGHVTISNGASATYVMQNWHIATRQSRFFVFMVHSEEIIPSDNLDWFLDSLASAVQAGRIRLARSSVEALGH